MNLLYLTSASFSKQNYRSERGQAESEAQPERGKAL